MRQLLRAAPRLSSRLPAQTCCASLQNGQQRRQYSRPQQPTNSWLPIPFVTETLAGMSHTTDLFSRLLKERIVAVYGEVDDRMAATVTASLLYLEAESDRPISMYINSPGGSVTAGLAIYDCMQYIVPEVSTLVLGQAASMGSLLLAGGQAGRRYALPHSSIMLHQPSGGHYGTAADIAIHAKEILRIRTQLNKIYEKHLTGKTKMTIDDIEKMMERDHFVSAEEALELGVVDEILGSRKKKAEEKEDK
ncbi:ATP-dependent Clp endopeptidase, proteolytic subunit ClpP [Exophiala oligosperma]|uniref:ATP-dependent Clp protease proteolytic subunit n=1 Tax=Exophiala oligosperma TaxID=215243 RepID=A0A0D2DZA6_9EURO|nr:ATP-dependent Clp endopeptidase, proteolytic subunit ClpP [Exophiala oligosperma]KIW48433.1 ATP-dependent Clp endopeptidase, proteolytic subunit ClpP [Exophiala oligosperma]